MRAFTVLFFLMPYLAFNQNTLPPIFEIKEDKARYTIDSSFVQILEDKDNNLNFEQVLKTPYAQRFAYAPKYDPTRNARVYWTRLRIKNRLPQKLNLFLYEGSSGFSNTFFQDTTGRWIERKAGELRAWSEIDTSSGDKERFRVYFELNPGQFLTVYQRLEIVPWKNSLRYIELNLEQSYERKNLYFKTIKTNQGWKDIFFEGLMIGILFLAASYNLYIFFSTQDSVYLYFSICLFFITLDRQSDRIQAVFFQEYAYVFSILYCVLFPIFFVFFILSNRKLLQSSIVAPNIDKWVVWLLIPTTIGEILTHFSIYFSISQRQYIFLTVEVFIRIICFLLLWVNIKALKQNTNSARFLLTATLPLYMLWLYALIPQMSYALLNTYWLSKDSFTLLPYLEKICFTWLIISFSGILISRFNQYRQKTIDDAAEKERLEREKNKIIESQNEWLEREVHERTTELHQSLVELRATQAQLIQKEKLASLGELTAGIAHEIQNPLNFVNNFAELSVELIEELGPQTPEGGFTNSPFGGWRAFFDDLRQNLEKINHHGKRASSIVKGMLEHSRMGTGEKQPTDINKLADEYLRLSYHGMRAKDKDFQADYELIIDESLPLVNVVPQDIGRVLLNLINNAFYAVKERHSKSQRFGMSDYRPKVTLTTQHSSDGVLMQIVDNGTGMTETTKAKIFQPFFTTKPTGEGTGLGLSLAYDIVTKGHGGTIEVESVEGEGTTFTVKLPYS